MMERSLSSPSTTRLAVGVMAAALALTGFTARAQVTGSSQTTTDAQGHQQESATLSVSKPSKKERVSKDEKVKTTKDTRAEAKKDKKLDPLASKDAALPDKQLYDKALAQIKSGHFDVARLDLNTLLSTYPESQYLMRSKLAIADAWYREGGSAALAQAEQEYKDFITFFPNAPEAAEAQMRVGDIYFKQMDVPDRDYSKAQHAEEEYRTMLKQYPDAPKEILAQAQQKLRDVQEVLAQREADIGAFYASHEDWPAALARYETTGSPAMLRSSNSTACRPVCTLALGRPGQATSPSRSGSSRSGRSPGRRPSSAQRRSRAAASAAIASRSQAGSPAIRSRWPCHHNPAR